MRAAFLLLALLAAPAAAHEIPPHVRVQALVRAQGPDLRIYVRVPLESLRDLDLPLHGPGYLDLAGAAPLMPDAARVWIADYITVLQGDVILPHSPAIATRIAQPSDPVFAFAAPPLSTDTQLMWTQAMVDVELTYRLRDTNDAVTIEPRLAHLGVRTQTSLTYERADGSTRTLEYVGDPGRIPLEPRWYHAARTFVRLGFLHILEGIDHLLFVLCLVIPFRRIRPLIGIVTAFTVAHSITLVAAALGYAPRVLWFPPLVETLIAASIVFMAIENVFGARLERRWALAFGFGLIHGFGFSFAVGESLQFAGSQVVAALFAFNVGVELGQVLVLAIAVPLLVLLFRHVPERAGVIVLSACIAHEAWHWCTGRFADFRAYEFVWPAFDLVFVLRALVLALIAAAGFWLLRLAAPRFQLQRES